MIKKLCGILAIVLMLTMVTLPVSASEDKSPNTLPKNGSTQITINDKVTPIKSYKVSVGKSYTLPATLHKAGNIYTSNDTVVMTVDKMTGNFKTLSNGAAYIVVTNGTTNSFIKVTVGTGAAVGTTKSRLSGYTVGINDTATLATNTVGKVVNGELVHYFVSADGKVLGSISADTYRKIAQHGVDTNTIPIETKEQTVWFANEFNTYRGLGKTTVATTNNNNNVDVEEYRQEVIRLTNAEREKNGLPILEISEDAMTYAQTRAEEISIDFSHTRPNGGEKTVNGNATLENAHMGSRTPQTAVNAWVNSKGHFGSMMDKNIYEIGVGVYQDSNGKLHWVQIFVW